MTGRERLLRAISHRETDRVPVSPFIFNNFIGEYFGSENLDFNEKGAQLYRHFGFDIMLRTCTVGGYLDEKLCDSKNWRVSETRVDKAPGEWEIITVIKTPERELRQVNANRRITPFEVVNANTECFIKEPEDFAQFKKYQPSLPAFDYSTVRQAREIVGDDGIAAPWMQGAFNMMGMMRKLEDLYSDPYLEPELFGDMAEYFSGRMFDLAAGYTGAGADLICAGGNMATATMAGPDFFRNHILPIEKKLFGKVAAAGGRTLYHNCGDASKLLPFYSEIGMDVYESMTPPPYGDTDFDEALSIIDKNITLCGNIDQVTFLREAKPDEIRQRVRSILEKAKERGNFILSTTDYFSEGTPEENILAFAEAGREFGSYE